MTDKEADPPFTPEQIEWLDARYRQNIVYLEKTLEKQQDGQGRK